MTTLKLSIRTKNHSHLLTTGIHSEADDPDVRIELLESRKAPGISTSELLLNIAISFGTGVPAGIAANWLFTKLAVGRDTRVYDNTGELLTTVKQLEQKLEEFIQRKSNE